MNQQLNIKSHLSKYNDQYYHHGTMIQFLKKEDAEAFSFWLKDIDDYKLSSNTLFRSEKDMIRETGSLDAGCYLDIDERKRITMKPAIITPVIFKFWETVNMFTGKIWVLDFMNGQVVAFEKQSDMPMMSALMSSYEDSKYPFYTHTFSASGSGTIYTNSTTLIGNTNLSIDLDNVTFTKNGANVTVQTV